MAKYNGKYFLICVNCSERVGKYNKNTDQLTCKDVCDCGCDDFEHEDEATFYDRTTGGLDSDV